MADAALIDWKSSMCGKKIKDSSDREKNAVQTSQHHNLKHHYKVESQPCFSGWKDGLMRSIGVCLIALNRITQTKSLDGVCTVVLKWQKFNFIVLWDLLSGAAMPK